MSKNGWLTLESCCQFQVVPDRWRQNTKLHKKYWQLVPKQMNGVGHCSFDQTIDCRVHRRSEPTSCLKQIYKKLVMSKFTRRREQIVQTNKTKCNWSGKPSWICYRIVTFTDQSVQFNVGTVGFVVKHELSLTCWDSIPLALLATFWNWRRPRNTDKKFLNSEETNIFEKGDRMLEKIWLKPIRDLVELLHWLVDGVSSSVIAERSVISVSAKGALSWSKRIEKILNPSLPETVLLHFPSKSTIEGEYLLDIFHKQ